MHKYDVFLCHHSQDKPLVRLVAEALRARGITPWLDQTDLRPGDEWRGTIDEALETVDATIVFLGENPEGSIQKAEISRALSLAGKGSVRLIPALLPSWPEGQDFRGLIGAYSGVSFNVADVDPVTELCRGIRAEYVEPALPVVAVAPFASEDFRRDLITYCHNGQVLVPRAGIYPRDEEAAGRAFSSDLGRSQLVVQERAELSSPGVFRDLVSRFEPQSRVIEVAPDRELFATVGQKIVERAGEALELPPPEQPSDAIDQNWLAMVKYCPDDGEPIDLVSTLSSANIMCMPTDNGLSMVDTFREFPFQAVIVVLGDGPAAWKMARGKELLTVVLKCKDNAPPLTVYYHRDGKRSLPPLTVPRAIEIDGPAGVQDLITKIHEQGGVQ